VHQELISSPFVDGGFPRLPAFKKHSTDQQRQLGRKVCDAVERGRISATRGSYRRRSMCPHARRPQRLRTSARMSNGLARGARRQGGMFPR
jgi:hypothetical protein